MCNEVSGKAWPDGIGISLEETGTVVRFLSVHVVAMHSLTSRLPFDPNLKFALGLEELQHTARLGSFLHASVTVLYYMLYTSFGIWRIPS